MSRRFVYYGAGGAGGIDPDAQAFLDSAGIVDATITGAIDTLVKDLKSNSLWSKFRYIYPFVGGTATTNKFNLKDPRDLDVAFRLQFFGGITFTSGFNPNGTNGYGNTFCKPNLNVTLNSEHFFITSNTNNTPTSDEAIETGSVDSATKASWMGIRALSPGYNSFAVRLNSDLRISTNSNAIGSFCSTKNGSTTLKLYKNGATELNTTGGGSLPEGNIFVGTIGIGGVARNKSLTNQNYTFATYGDGLSDTDVANLTNIEQAFNITLGR